MSAQYNPSTGQFEFIDNDPDDPKVGGSPPKGKIEIEHRDISCHPYIMELFGKGATDES